MTAYEMRIRDWSSDVCSSDLHSSVSDRKHRASGLLVLYRLYMSHQEVCLGGSDFDDPALAAQPLHRAPDQQHIEEDGDERRDRIAERRAQRDRKSTRLNSSH